MTVLEIGAIAHEDCDADVADITVAFRAMSVVKSYPEVTSVLPEVRRMSDTLDAVPVQASSIRYVVSDESKMLSNSTDVTEVNDWVATSARPEELCSLHVVPSYLYAVSVSVW